MTIDSENNTVAGVEVSAPATSMLPDEAALQRDLGRGNFVSGVDRGRWRLLGIEWPLVYIAVSAPSRQGGPAEFVFRFDCTRYPHQAPTSQPWDMATNAPLAHGRWPGGTGRVATAFNPGWVPNPGVHAVYLPCDRVALHGHDQWRQQHASLIWTADKDITFYLGVIHGLLDSPEYTGIRAPGA